MKSKYYKIFTKKETGNTHEKWTDCVTHTDTYYLTPKGVYARDKEEGPLYKREFFPHISCGDYDCNKEGKCRDYITISQVEGKELEALVEEITQLDNKTQKS
jgi:hypothetical protein